MAAGRLQHLLARLRGRQLFVDCQQPVGIGRGRPRGRERGRGTGTGTQLDFTARRRSAGVAGRPAGGPGRRAGRIGAADRLGEGAPRAIRGPGDDGRRAPGSGGRGTGSVATGSRATPTLHQSRSLNGRSAATVRGMPALSRSARYSSTDFGGFLSETRSCLAAAHTASMSRSIRRLQQVVRVQRLDAEFRQNLCGEIRQVEGHDRVRPRRGWPQPGRGDRRDRERQARSRSS